MTTKGPTKIKKAQFIIKQLYSIKGTPSTERTDVKHLARKPMAELDELYDLATQAWLSTREGE